MRRLFLQREVLEMARLLGWPKLSRDGLRWWKVTGKFPNPVSSVPGLGSWYKREDIIEGFVLVSVHQRKGIREDDVKRVMSEILAKNKKVTRELRRLCK